MYPVTNLFDMVKQLERMFNKLARDTYKILVKMNVDIDDFYGQVSSMDISLDKVAGNFFEECSVQLPIWLRSGGN